MLNASPIRTIDVHQHLLGEALVEALARRTEPPMLVRRRDGWTFRLAAEPDSVLTFAATDVESRRAELGEDGIDGALVALSTALGIETLPAEDAVALIEAHHHGIEVLPPEFGGWGAVPLAGPELDPTTVDAAIDRGCVGISLPAAALVDPAAVARLGPLLVRLELRGAPLFIHPGPVGGVPTPDAAHLPHWWPALTDYVAQMQAAWFAFLHAGRRAHPRLRVLFAMLAGGAPLQLERYSARRGVPAPDPDPLVFYDTSSYGPRMIAAVAEVVGTAQLVYGSDRPVVDPRRPRLDPDLRRALVATNPSRLLNPDPKGALA
ncbi:MAG: amidohydrolase family protein [Actinobacteria bacterium]|nr:amidohydrolase family protein [Actinomycetota bacterium]